MDLYYFNDNIDEYGNHEVHKSTCSCLPSSYNRIMIGYYPNCASAINAAKIKYPYRSFDGCYFCCRECHKG